MHDAFATMAKANGAAAAGTRPAEAPERMAQARPFVGTATPVVAHLTTSLDVGGAQTMLAKLAGARSDDVPLRHCALSLMPPA